jgi:hypothetical protein
MSLSLLFDCGAESRVHGRGQALSRGAGEDSLPDVSVVMGLWLESTRRFCYLPQSGKVHEKQLEESSSIPRTALLLALFTLSKSLCWR